MSEQFPWLSLEHAILAVAASVTLGVAVIIYVIWFMRTEQPRRDEAAYREELARLGWRPSLWYGLNWALYGLLIFILAQLCKYYGIPPATILLIIAIYLVWAFVRARAHSSYASLMRITDENRAESTPGDRAKPDV